MRRSFLAGVDASLGSWASLLAVLAVASPETLPAETSSPQEIDFVVKNTIVQPVEIVVPPEFPDLPEVRGVVNAFIQVVEDPGPGLLTASRSTDAAPVESEPEPELADEELFTPGEATRMIGLTVTWYPQEQCSRVQWQEGQQAFECLNADSPGGPSVIVEAKPSGKSTGGHSMVRYPVLRESGNFSSDRQGSGPFNPPDQLP